MKNLLLILLTLTFTISSSAQYAVMSAVDLNEGGEKEYLALEEFFSAINKEAVKQGLQTGQYVYKRTPKEGDEANAPEYFIFNTYSSMEQFQQGINWQELALKVYKGKMSKRAINRMLNNSTYNAEKERRSYVFKVVDATIRAGGALKVGDKGTINLMNKKSDDFESYESEIWKPVAEQNILAGNLRQWVLVEAIDRSENAYDGWTHMAWNLQAENPGEYNIPSGFEWDKLWEGIQSSRDMTDSTELTCVYSTED
tara:strand:+ start:288 stop:1052 length:765 start_codon:yes stop_codon:yes gene_type:complete